MTLGNVLGTTFATWFRNAPRFFLLTVLGYVPIVGFYVLLANDRASALVSRIFQWFWELHPAMRFSELPNATWIPLGIFGGAIAACVVAQLRDERVSIWRGLALALRRAHWIILVALVARLMTAGVMTLIEILRWDDKQWFPRRSELTVIGYGAIWVVMSSIFVTAIPVAVVERRGVFGALARAWRLARGAWWKVLAVMLVHYVLRTAISYTLYYVMVVNGDALDRDRFMVFAYVRLGIDIVMAPLAPILAATLYERLRASTEGPAETQLERVFD